MALKVNLRHLETKDLELEGELALEELDLDVKDEVIRLEQPLWYALTVSKMEEALLVKGRLELPLSCECVRCLKRFEDQLVLDPWAVHLPLAGEDATPVNNDCVDLTPFIREDILLDFPQHPLCAEDCRGLTADKAGDQRPEVEKPESAQAESSAWSELNKLKF